MKTLFTAFLFLFIFTVIGQTVNEDYADGHMYIKLRKTAGVSFIRSQERIPDPALIGFLRPLTEKYGIRSVTRPFAAANDDAVLPYVLRIQFDAIFKTDEFVADLKKIDEIEYAEKVPLARVHATPNDYSISSASLHLNQINAQNAWNVFNGNSNITVAIVDNGVMWSHVDLVANTYTNAGETPANGTDDDGNGFVDDVNGFDVADWDNDAQPASTLMNHGTMCAGIAGATTDNNTGIASIGWNIKIIPVKAQPDAGSPSVVLYGYEGIIYASRAKARVISCSFGSNVPSSIELAVVNYAWNRGSIIIASAGNSFVSTINYPAAYPNVYAVAAVDASDVKIGMSTYAPWVDISAPGDNIYTTFAYTGSPGYGNGTGTSMATPLVAGLAGLMLSKSPAMTRQDVLNCISSTAVNIYTLSGNATYSNQLGAGRIDAFAAMTCAAGYSALPPVANFTGFMRNTCPNTPVQFTDSSLYLPTAWNWTFQGGTPATSTLANPVVQWSTPGSYSVALTVTNANGNDTKIKTAYINVSGPVSLPLQEGFQQTTFLPSGWGEKNIMNDSMYWQRVTGVGGYGTSTACARFNNYDYSVEGERDEMLTPKYSFTNVAKALLHFDVAYARYDQDYSDTLEIKLSTNCGVSWTTIYLKGGSTLATKGDQSNFFVPSSAQWRTDTIDISTLAAGQGNVMFSFVNRGFYGQPIYIDNINLLTPAPTVSPGHPATVCEGAGISFSANVSGASGYTLFAPTGSPAVTANQSVVTLSFGSAGIHSVTIVAENGSGTRSVQATVSVIATPTVVVNNATICIGSTATLTASGANSYSWSSGSTASVSIVTPSVTTAYSVTGTSAPLCSSTATVLVVVTTPTVNAIGATTNNACSSACNGIFDATVTSGTPPYSISVSGGTCSQLPCTGLCSGPYTVTISDVNGCITKVTGQVQDSAPLSASISMTPNSCASCNNGELSLHPTGGTPPYNIVWNNGSFGPVVSNLAVGCYTATITDALGCTMQYSACVADVTGLTEKESLPPAIFPNPAKDELTISLSGTGAVCIYNNLSQLIFRDAAGGTLNIDVSGWARGSYLVVVKEQARQTYRKLLLR